MVRLLLLLDRMLDRMLPENRLPNCCFWLLRPRWLGVRVDALSGQDARHFHKCLQVLEAAGLAIEDQNQDRQS